MPPQKNDLAALAAVRHRLRRSRHRPHAPPRPLPRPPLTRHETTSHLPQILLLAMMGFNSKGYMNVSPLKFCIEGGMGGGKYGLSYVLFWTLSYALIYIY